MASLQLIQGLLLATACVVVWAECNHTNNLGPYGDFAVLLMNQEKSLKQLEQRLDDVDLQLNQTREELKSLKELNNGCNCTAFDDHPDMSHEDEGQNTSDNGCNGTDCVDCATLYHEGQHTSGVYTIYPQCGAGVNVSCDMETDGGGWTVFQKRYNGTVDFYRGWDDYAQGFGDPAGEYWLGLSYIHNLTQCHPSELYVALTDFDVGAVYAKYGVFNISSEADKFRLTVGNYSGNAGDSLNYNSGEKFSTNDEDNDGSSTDCSTDNHGAWWYKDCTESNLNGRFSATKVSDWTYMTWYYLHSSHQSMKTTVMMMRPANFKP